MYAADYDMVEDVPYSASAVRAFQRLCRTRVGKIVDIKCGEVKEWNLLKGAYNYNKTSDELSALWKEGVVTDAEYKTTRALLKPHLTPTEVLEVRKELRFGILRWTPAEVVAGYMKFRGRVFYIEQACKTGITKIDMVAWLKDKYVEVSNIIVWTRGGKPLVKLLPFRRGIVEDIAMFLKEGNYIKVAKRMLSLAKVEKHSDEEKLIDLLNSPLGAIYVVVSDLQLLEEFPDAVRAKKREELDWLRDRVTKLYYPEFDDATSAGRLLPALYEVLQAKTKKELEARGLLPLSKLYKL
jgi:hypothetical protein